MACGQEGRRLEQKLTPSITSNDIQDEKRKEREERSQTHGPKVLERSSSNEKTKVSNANQSGKSKKKAEKGRRLGLNLSIFSDQLKSKDRFPNFSVQPKRNSRPVIKARNDKQIQSLQSKVTKGTSSDLSQSIIVTKTASKASKSEWTKEANKLSLKSVKNKLQTNAPAQRATTQATTTKILANKSEISHSTNSENINKTEIKNKQTILVPSEFLEPPSLRNQRVFFTGKKPERKQGKKEKMLKLKLKKEKEERQMQGKKLKKEEDGEPGQGKEQKNKVSSFLPQHLGRSSLLSSLPLSRVVAVQSRRGPGLMSFQVQEKEQKQEQEQKRMQEQERMQEQK